MRKFVLAAAALALPLTATPLHADAHMEAPQLANKEWYNIVFFKFHPGKMGEAMELIEVFEAVDQALGRESPRGLHMNTGEWDMIVAFKMEDGIAAMGWETNPRSEAWNAELARQLGSEEAVREHWAKWQSTIARSESHIAHVDLD